MKKGCLRAKSRAFSAVIPKGGFAPLRYVPAGTVATPFLEAFAAWPALCCAKMHGFATASFFPGRFFYFSPFFISRELFRRSVPAAVLAARHQQALDALVLH